MNLLNKDDLEDMQSIHLINCIIETVDLIGVFELESFLILEGCIIQNLNIHSCWFKNGLIIKNSIINSHVDYQMGGHNLKPFIFDGNIFKSFLNFFDCHFNCVIELKNNVLIEGTNLLGNLEEGFANTFVEGWIVENNVGNVDKNGI